jgi:division protein CdvB (Snf7/Vps24/ESCRT-III family)
MDDGTIGGTVEQLLKDFRVIVEEGKKLGLVVNTRKCEVITDDDDVVEKFKSVAPEITHVKTSSAMLLGAPVGSEQSVDEVLENKL